MHSPVLFEIILPQNMHFRRSMAGTWPNLILPNYAGFLVFVFLACRASRTFYMEVLSAQRSCSVLSFITPFIIACKNTLFTMWPVFTMWARCRVGFPTSRPHTAHFSRIPATRATPVFVDRDARAEVFLFTISTTSITLPKIPMEPVCHSIT